VQVDDVTTRASEPPDAVLRYAAHDDGLIDVHLPADVTRPRHLVVLVHGGFWRQRYDRTHARPLANALVEQGFVVALPEYRRGPTSWPRTVEDLQAALAALPTLLDGLAVPTTSTTFAGHSAGGHLVLWLANEGYDVRRVVALAPVADLRFAADTGMGDGAAPDFLGGPPEQLPAVYDAADPAHRLTDRPATEVVVVHGEDDETVDVGSSRRLVARHPWIDYRELPGVDHLALVDPLSGAWPAVLAAISGA
jgi:acetyl esterase/lipase